MTPATDILSSVISVYLINEERACISLRSSAETKKKCLLLYMLPPLVTDASMHPAGGGGGGHIINAIFLFRKKYETIY
jgi:hypothetical protein